jgi:hypothetical protein
MDALRRKWPSMVLAMLGLPMLFAGYQSFRAVKMDRQESIERTAVITDLNPLKQRVAKNNVWIWIGIRYLDEDGDIQSALAHARYNSSIVAGDSVVALFGKGKKSAIIKSWRDWMNSVGIIVIGFWMLAIGILIRNLPGHSSSKTRGSRTQTRTEADASDGGVIS